MSPSGAQGCTGHAWISEELHGLVELFATRVQPWLERVAQQPGESPGADGGPCTWCPVCALITALRGDHPEAVTRLAEHGAGLIAAARELLTPPAASAPPAESAPSAASTPPAASARATGEPAAEGAPAQRPAAGRSVQHIVVRPAAGGSRDAAGC